MTNQAKVGGPVVRSAMNEWMGGGKGGRVNPDHRRRAIAALRHSGNLVQAIRSFATRDDAEREVIDMLSATAQRFLKADRDSGQQRAEAIRRRVLEALEAGQRVTWDERSGARWAVICDPPIHDPAATELRVTIQRPDASACRPADIRIT
jgi:hypothetical protein